MVGYYIEVPNHHQKAKQISQLYGGIITSKPRSFQDIPEGKALIVVVDNGPFEAAGFVYSEREFQEFTRLDDPRPKWYVFLDWNKAVELTGYRAK